MRSAILYFSIVVALCTTLAACGSSSAASPVPAPSAAAVPSLATPIPTAPLPQPSPAVALEASPTPTPAPAPVVTVAPDTASPRTTIALASYSFSPSTITARVGQPVRLTLANGDSINHQFAIDNSDVDVQVTPGTSQKLDFVFSKPGTYIFACNLTEEGNHRASGMVGKIVVGP